MFSGDVTCGILARMEVLLSHRNRYIETMFIKQWPYTREQGHRETIRHTPKLSAMPYTFFIETSMTGTVCSREVGSCNLKYFRKDTVKVRSELVLNIKSRVEQRAKCSNDVGHCLFYHLMTSYDHVRRMISDSLTWVISLHPSMVR